MAPKPVVGIRARTRKVLPALVEVGNPWTTHDPEITDEDRPGTVGGPQALRRWGLGRYRPPRSSMRAVRPPPDADDWVGLTQERLPVEAALAWAVLPGCGAVVTFAGTVRDHAEGRSGVTGLCYEAYPEHAEPRLAAIAASARRRWPQLGRLALLHRLGTLGIGETSVVVVASAPHRAEAFAVASHCIDAVKATVPVWKREAWSGGTDWGTGAVPVEETDREVGSPW